MFETKKVKGYGRCIDVSNMYCGLLWSSMVEQSQNSHLWGHNTFRRIFCCRSMANLSKLFGMSTISLFHRKIPQVFKNKTKDHFAVWLSCFWCINFSFPFPKRGFFNKKTRWFRLLGVTTSHDQPARCACLGPGESTRKWSTVPNEFRKQCPFPASTRWMDSMKGGGGNTWLGWMGPVFVLDRMLLERYAKYNRRS